MPIYKLADGRFKVQVNAGKQWDGTYKRLTKVCETEKEAIRVEKRFEKEKESAKNDFSGHMRLEVLYEEWIKSLSHARHTTVSIYKRHVNNYILPSIGRRTVGSITRSDVQRVIAACPTDKTARKVRATLHTLLQYAVYDGLIESNPAAGQFRYRQSLSRRKEYGIILTRFSEHREFLENVKDSNVWGMYVLGLCFGLRKGEILGLEWSDVDLEKRVIRIKQTVTSAAGSVEIHPPKTPRGNRTIPMTDFAHDALKVIEGTKMEGSRYVVTNKAGSMMKPSLASSRIKDYFEKHPELPRVTLFTCRHSFITACFRENINPATIQAWAGHERMTTTMGYVKYLPDESMEDVASINEAFKSQPSANSSAN